jgi:heptosyltransferase-2
MKILVNCQSGLGINLLAVPTLRAIRRNVPGAYVHLVVQLRSGMELLTGCPYVDDISMINYGMLKDVKSMLGILRRMRDHTYDCSFMLFPANRLDKNLFHLLMKARTKVSHEYTFRKYLNLNNVNNMRIAVNPDLHDVEQNLSLLRVIGVDWKNEPAHLELFLDPAHHAKAGSLAASMGKGKKIVGIHPGSSREFTMELKRWPSEYFARMGDMLKERFGCEVFIFGGRDEDNVKSQVRDNMKTGCVIVEQMDIRTTAALIGKCSLFLSNDSGLMHVAAAAGVRTIGIFGPTDHVRTAPRGRGNLVVRRGISCSPCFSIRKVGQKIRCIHEKRICLTDLLPENVMDEIEPIARDVLANQERIDAHR